MSSVNTDDISARTFNVIAFVNTEILYNSFSPAVQDPAFTDFMILEYLLLAFSATYCQHGPVVCLIS
jgi:hypothetical protein